MADERTEYQSQQEQSRARRLSLQRTEPPGQPAGYEMQRFLGAGAYGEVWVAQDRNTGRQVAIKFYLHRGGLDWTLLSREVEKLVFLSADRYVVQLLEVGWDADPPYYVMEYVENGSLDDLLRDHGRLSPEEAAVLFREIAIGLTHAHGKGVLHCDLKPANILLDQDHRPRLADFGQSRLSHEQTPALGTLFYMAPEQADLRAVPDARWDVYALGAMLFCMLTGSPPHRENARIQRIDAAPNLPARLESYRREICEGPVPDQHRQIPGVDGMLADIVDRCLAIDPETRYPNVQAVLDALQTRQEARMRRPLMLLGLVAPAVLLLIMIAVYFRAFGRAVDQAERMVTRQTYRSNQFAAKFLAKSFEAELASNFEFVERESRQPQLREALAIASQSLLLAKLDDPHVDPEQLTTLREQFLADPARGPLTDYLQNQLDRLNADAGVADAQFASLFVVSRRGTMIADAYPDRIATRSVGRNFSWRTYFHGGPEDLTWVRSEELPAVIETTHLSAVFKSRTTERWKIAITTPILDPAQPDQPVLGVLALTIDVGDFAVFRSQDEATDYFAILVDNRPGERRGTILQHPLYRKQPPARDFLVSERQLAGIQREPFYPYQDPLADAPGGELYAGRWIAAAESVDLPKRGSPARGNGRTDLLVLVQVHADVATAPVVQLGRRLTFEGLVALALIVSAVAALWIIVIRIPWHPGQRRSEGVILPSGSSSWQDVATLSATRRIQHDAIKPPE
ncbi:MAG: serine/threonine protein kinase [Pirellulaceae bacterium]|nr:serine/threonine protein kinase [Pirellulaceae bacterium]